MSDLDGSATIAVVGGTGNEGKGLAYRLAKAGYRVVIGSRSQERAAAAAAELGQLVVGKSLPSGMSNADAANEANIVLLTVPYGAHEEILSVIKPAMNGKLLIDATVPLLPGRVTRAHRPAAGSAAQEAYQILGEGVEIAAAFHNISHEHLFQEDMIDCDVLVTGTSKTARSDTLKIVEAIGLRGWDAGPIENSAISEGLTSVLIHINKQYGSKSAGIRVTGVRGR
jgi:hypothetical protein